MLQLSNISGLLRRCPRMDGKSPVRHSVVNKQELDNFFPSPSGRVSIVKRKNLPEQIFFFLQQHQKCVRRSIFIPRNESSVSCICALLLFVSSKCQELITELEGQTHAPPPSGRTWCLPHPRQLLRLQKKTK